MSRHMVIPAVHLFLIKDHQILLARRFQTGYEDGKYSVPAGHIESGETATHAMIREAKEEIGIHISALNLKVIGVMHRRSDSERIDFFFQCSKWDGKISNIEPEKCDDLRWFPVLDLPNNMVPYVRFAIANYRKSIFYSEYGWHGEFESVSLQ